MKKIKIQIVSWLNGSVLFEYECADNTVAKTAEKAVENNADLRSADLRYADLRYADLSYADLSSANLRSANLSSANLRYANLRSANLRSANLSSADLSSANLSSANLRSANLSSADLSSANLRYANLRSANLSYANLSSANLRYADLSYADLRYADLSYANLSSADLRYANLRSANLSYADLSSADLRYANLRYAKNLLPYFKNDNLSILRNQKNKLIAYKYLDDDMKSPVQDSGKIEYKIGKVITEKKYNDDEFEQCGDGLNVATLEWCLKENNGDIDKTYIEVEFDPKDIVAIPWATDGKFRVKKLKVLRKLTKKDLKKYVTPIKEKK